MREPGARLATFGERHVEGSGHGRLVVLGPASVLVVPLRASVVLGRGPDVSVAVKDKLASRRHVCLEVVERALMVSDLGSRNGARLDGEPLPKATPTPVPEGALVGFGSHVVFVEPTTGPRWVDASEIREHVAVHGARTFVLRPHGGTNTDTETHQPVDDRAGEDRALRSLLDILVSVFSPHTRVTRDASGTFLLAIDDHDAPSLERAALALEGVGLELSEAARSPLHTDAVDTAPLALVKGTGPFDERRIAESDITVLIVGETGVGKDVLARVLHGMSRRATGRFVVVNCAAIAESLFESELFGHERGAFTGATVARQGYLESAAGGTLFLDEVGELPMTLQAKLLRVLEERAVVRVGSVIPRPVDVRFMAATLRDLPALVSSGRFREDLYYRLSGVTLRVPPLRDRRDELPGLSLIHISEPTRPY